jgi:hypothetical protein
MGRWFERISVGVCLSVGSLVVAEIPQEMRHPEGRTRWDLSTLTYDSLPDLQVEQAGEAPLRLDLGESRSIEQRRNDGWWRFELTGREAGWVHLPSGPAEVQLQQVRVFYRETAAEPWTPVRHGYRWSDRVSGTLAAIAWHGAGPGGELVGASLGPSEPEAHQDTRIYANDLSVNQAFTDLNYAWDRGADVPVSALEPSAYANIGALLAASSWNFSQNTSGRQLAETTTPITSSETCNATRCGYSPSAGRLLGRRDTNFDNAPTLEKSNQVTERQNRASDVVFWLRAGAQKEGKTGIFGTGESRYCYDPPSRNAVPLYIMSRFDAARNDYYFAPGDHWEGGPVGSCQQTLFNQTCGAPNLFDILYAKSCTASGEAYSGKQFGDVIKTGVVTVPSGHTFNAVVQRYVAEFCVYNSSSCFDILRVDRVRTVNYLWHVPHLGSVARVQSDQDVRLNDFNNGTWSNTKETQFSFGLFPPRTISVTGTTSSTVSLSWDPGLITTRITNYKIYWDTDSGGSSAYAFNSDTQAGQVSFSGTTATISGLTPGQQYFFTVTARSDYRDPSTTVVTRYESLVYPTQVFGDPDKAYPTEVLATPGACTPTQQVSGLTVSKSGGSNLQFCWNAVTDSCLSGYRLIGSNNATSAAGWTTVADTNSSTTCFTGNPSQTFYLVHTRGGGTDGPWGHYGR